MNIVKFNSAEDFFNNFNKKKIEIIEKISEDITSYNNYEDSETDSSKIRVRNFKDIHNWSANKKSDTLDALADKIYTMATKTGNPNSIFPMLRSMIEHSDGKKIDVLRNHKVNNSRKEKRYENGHFYWNYKHYLLTSSEIAHLKKVLSKYE